MAGSSWSDALRAGQGPSFGGHLKGRKLECRRNGAADQGPVAQTVSRLPSLRWDNDLRSCAPHEVGSESQPCCRARIMQRNLQFKSGAGMIVPDLHSIDLVPAGALTSRQQEINGARCGPRIADLEPIAKGFTKMATFGMRLEIEQLNHLGRRKVRHRTDAQDRFLRSLISAKTFQAGWPARLTAFASSRRSARRNGFAAFS